MCLEEKPIFVRGLSRSGGTLMVTILDAHPDIAMTYELYPTLLEKMDNSISALESYIDLFSKARNLKQVAKKIVDGKFKTFILRCDRGGLDVKDLELIFQEQVSENRSLETHQDRLELIAKCCRKKMNREGKSRWGLKCNNKYNEYLSVWPNAYFLNMIRDGRDVLASQLNTGSFKATPKSLGISWANTHRTFKTLVNDPEVNAYEIIYEKLVTESSTEIEQIVSFLGLNYDADMLNFHNKNLTIFSASHLSMNRISVGIDSTKIGRWQKDLTEQQANEFFKATDGLMSDFKYK